MNKLSRQFGGPFSLEDRELQEVGQDLCCLSNFPPDSNHKESTKLGVSQLNVSEVSASSPARARSEDTLRESREGTFTKI